MAVKSISLLRRHHLSQRVIDSQAVVHVIAISLPRFSGANSFHDVRIWAGFAAAAFTNLVKLTRTGRRRVS
jgi:hypothetical protein